MCPHVSDYHGLNDFLNMWDAAQHDVACSFLGVSCELNMHRDDIVGDQRDIDESAVF
jgi:hypothetical protein